MVALGQIDSGKVFVDFPDEPTTGADMQWDFVNFRKRTVLRLMLQAKRSFGKGKFGDRHSYRHIDHKVGGVLQSVTLCKQSIASTAGPPGVLTVPLYIFYHSEDTCSKTTEPLLDVALACGHCVNSLVSSGKKSNSRTFRSIRKYQKLHFPMSEIFCPYDGGDALDPQKVLRRISKRVNIKPKRNVRVKEMPREIMVRVGQEKNTGSTEDLPFRIPTITFVSNWEGAD